MEENKKNYYPKLTKESLEEMLLKLAEREEKKLSNPQYIAFFYSEDAYKTFEKLITKGIIERLKNY